MSNNTDKSKNNYKDRNSLVQSLTSTVSVFHNTQLPISKAIESIMQTSNQLSRITNNFEVFPVSSAAEAFKSQLYTDGVVSNIGDTLNSAASVMNFYDISYYSEMNRVLQMASKTFELAELQANLFNNAQAMSNNFSPISQYINTLQSQWANSFGITDVLERSIRAQNLAFVKLIPDYKKIDLPRGGKQVLRSLTKAAAEKLTKAEEVLFDPKDKEFFFFFSPMVKISADQVTVLESSQEQFADISLDDLISFESQLYEDKTFALEHPVGRKIFEIIQAWNSFISFGDELYYHARKVEKGYYFLDHEMLRAPINVSAHGRYNAIGKSCYYIAETKDGAINEILKHSGGTKPTIQVAGLKAIKAAKIIDLSIDTEKTNRFMEHLRYSVDNAEGMIIKEYLLPNFVASCCKKIGIEGIRYKSTGYNCIVLWKDDYFEFADGSREIIGGE